ncbi:MAG: 4'-phosphopantetheinyl transferase superfamily protein [Planctomycetota bacterium]|nr:4'-phosphopantetheinyl transferase superfamily protein [Planctomycetota bacterium]
MGIELRVTGIRPSGVDAIDSSRGLDEFADQWKGNGITGMVEDTTIEVWHAASSTGEPGKLEQTCENWLDPSERLRADAFRVPTSRNQHVVGRGMARRLLSTEAIDPELIRFATEPHGKPYVVKPEQAKRPFNVAHTDGLVMCGLGNGTHRLVGVDVERLDRRTDPELAERFFSNPEVDFLRQCSAESTRQATFLKIWTLKESFIKAIGTGLQTPLSDFAFRCIDSATPTIEMLNPKLNQGMTWRFFCFEPRPGFIGAIAVAPYAADATVSIELRSFDELV